MCQLCGRTGHVALKCFKRFDVHLTGTEVASNPQAYLSNVSDAPDYGESDADWVVDSGATSHITNSLANLDMNTAYTGSESLMVGNVNILPISSIGHNSIPLSSSNCSLLLNHILYVPEITKNLLSISQFTRDNNVFIEFHSTCCFVKAKDSHQILLKGSLHEGLYRLDLSSFLSKNKTSLVSSCVVSNSVNKGSATQCNSHQRVYVTRTCARSMASVSRSSLSSYSSSSV